MRRADSCHDGDGGAVLTGGLQVALLGSPNAGKTTLFNALTGLRAKTANYPGITVTRREAMVEAAGLSLRLVDLPGTYSLDPVSPDEMVVADALHGRGHERRTTVAAPVALQVDRNVAALDLEMPGRARLERRDNAVVTR